jgi:TRAP-type C4-dicarboxylate transport system permease small subunit
MPWWLDRAERVLTAVAASATFVMMALTTADAGGRYLLNRPILVAYELTTNYLMIAAVFLAMPLAYRNGANIRVTFAVDRLGGATRLVVDHAVQLVSLLYLAALVASTAQQAHHIFSTKTSFTTFEAAPLWPGYLAVSVGLLVTSAMTLVDLARVRHGDSSLFRER